MFPFSPNALPDRVCGAREGFAERRVHFEVGMLGHGRGRIWETRVRVHFHVVLQGGEDAEIGEGVWRARGCVCRGQRGTGSHRLIARSNARREQAQLRRH